MIVIIALGIGGFILLLYLIGRIRLAVQFRNQVKTLFAGSKHLSDRTFSKSQLDGLPEPVQRYFTYALKDGQPYMRYARIKHEGQFKAGIDKDWVSINGEQYATTETPGFIWKGTTSMFTARDMYIADEGRLTVTLLSLYNVVDARGEHYDRGELLRWLGESILYPTNLLPNERLRWLPINATTAKLTYNYNGLSLFFNIMFNETGQITEMETERYMDEKNLETWVIKVSDYLELNNVFIPTALEVIWRLDTGDFSYAKFNITTVEYNRPERF